MFTGIIENLGKLEKKQNSEFIFSAKSIFCNKIKKGTSVSVDGICLTVVKKPTKTTFLVEIMPETQQKTTLGKLKNKDIVNLELPATIKTFLSGHLVQGHIDGAGVLKSIKTLGNSKILKIQTTKPVLDFVVQKGSITINGISLTVVAVDKNYFLVAIIPFTWENTILSRVKIGDSLNIETDILGKYLKNYLNK